MSDRIESVLASIDQALDGADDDWDVSGDAMRWTPPGQEPYNPPRRPVDRYTMTTPTQSWSMTVPVTYTYVNHEAIDDLFGIDADDPRHEIQAGINQMHQDLADRLGCPVSQVRSFTEYLGHQISAASDMTPGEAEEQLLRFIEANNPPESPTPEELRRRALEHQQNRNTGPQARRQRLPREHRR